MPMQSTSPMASMKRDDGFMGDWSIQKAHERERRKRQHVVIHTPTKTAKTPEKSAKSAFKTYKYPHFSHILHYLRHIDPVKRKSIYRTEPDIEERQGPSIQVSDIMKAVCKYYPHITRDILIGSSRVRDRNYARQIVMCLAYLHTGKSYSEIGRELGGRDHSTILFGKDRVLERVNRGHKKFHFATWMDVAALEREILPDDYDGLRAIPITQGESA